jgi:hypothetical protein
MQLDLDPPPNQLKPVLRPIYTRKTELASHSSAYRGLRKAKPVPGSPIIKAINNSCSGYVKFYLYTA